MYVFIYTAKSPAELSILPHDSSIISEHQESSSFTMKRSVIVHSSSSHVTSSVSTAKSEPNVQVHSYTSQSEERFEQTGDSRPVQVGLTACSDPGLLQHGGLPLRWWLQMFQRPLSLWEWGCYILIKCQEMLPQWYMKFHPQQNNCGSLKSLISTFSTSSFLPGELRGWHNN